MTKIYLGDGVYADEQSGNLVLTTENGISVTNEIVLEPEVVSALQRFLTKLSEQEPPHQAGCICADCSGAELTSDND